MRYLFNIYFILLFYCCNLLAEDSIRIDTLAFKKHLNFLASDLFEGRATGSLGSELAAKYLANEFSKMQLRPVGNDGTYYQYIPMHSTKTLSSSKFVVYEKNNFTEFNLFDDYLVYKTGEQTFLPNRVDMVFAAYGIIAPEYDYNDYQSIDVRGKVVVVLDGEPDSDDESYFMGRNNTVYSNIESKMLLATSRGAIACIVLPNPASEVKFDWNRLKRNYMFDDVTLAYSVTSSLCLILHPDKAHSLFADSEYSLDEVFVNSITGNLHSFPLASKFSFKPAFKRNDFIGVNVVGMIKGSDSKLNDSYLIVSAHYDHLGVGPAIDGDSIYNGLTDNAMGCAALVEIARSISTMKKAPKRSILFILTSGEEKGLLGSTFYTDNPIFPLYKSIANVNIDGIAFIDNFRSVIAVGAEYSNLDSIIKDAVYKNGIEFGEIPSLFMKSESFFYSDQYAFAKAGVPSILLMEAPDFVNISYEDGLDLIIDYSNNIYHSPQDDLSLKINYSASYQHTELLLDVIMQIADTNTLPRWYNESPFYNAKLRNAAEKR